MLMSHGGTNPMIRSLSQLSPFCSSRRRLFRAAASSALTGSAGREIGIGRAVGTALPTFAFAEADGAAGFDEVAVNGLAVVAGLLNRFGSGGGVGGTEVGSGPPLDPWC